MRFPRWFADPGLSSVLIAALAVAVLAGTLLDAADISWAKLLFGWPCGILLSLIALQSLWAVIDRFISRSPASRMGAGLLITHTGLSLLLIGALLSGLTSREYVLGIAEGAESSEAFFRDGWDLGLTVDGETKSVPFESLVVGDRIKARNWNIDIAAIDTSSDLPAVTFALSSAAIAPQQVVIKAGTVGGETGAQSLTDLSKSRIDLGLEPRKTQLPFSIKLDRFEIQNYTNTNQASDYISSVQVRTGSSTQAAKISMNQPLRVSSYVVYQSSWEDLGSNKQASVFLLQFRPLAELPYIGAIVLGAGLLLYPLLRPARRRRDTRAKMEGSPVLKKSKNAPAHGKTGTAVLSKVGTFVVLATVLVLSCFAALLPGLRAAGTQVSYINVAGRVQPLESWLDRVIQKLDFENAIDPGGTSPVYAPGVPSVTGTDLLKGLLRTNPRAIADGPFLSLPASLLDSNGGDGDFRIRVSLNAILAVWDRVSGTISDDDRERVTLLSDLSSIADPFYKSSVFTMSDRLRALLGLPQGNLSFVQVGRAMRSYLADIKTQQSLELDAGLSRKSGDWQLVLGELIPLVRFADNFAARYAAFPLRVVPEGESWLRPIDLIWRNESSNTPPKTIVSYQDFERDIVKPVLTATAGLETMPASSWIEFQDYLAKKYQSWVKDPSAQGPVLETVYRAIPWFALMCLLIGLTLVLWLLDRFSTGFPRGPAAERTLAATLTWSQRASLVIAALLIWTHVVMRIVISGLPPISSLESSLLFVAGVVLLFALWFSFASVQKSLVLLLSLLSLAVSTIQILSLGGNDEFAPVVAVLHTPFWLAIHVTVVVSGYALVLIAAVLGHIRLLRLLKKDSQDLQIQSPSAQGIGVLRGFMVAGLACASMGTILGGFWADQSWGRFWGWDPKENGALLIVLWTAFTLHLWVAGRLSPLKFAALSAWSATPVVFSWFGINFLGKGLHSYGFSQGPLILILAFTLGETALLCFAFLRERAFSKERGQRLLAAGARPAVIVAKHDLGDSISELWLQVDGGASFPFNGGDAVKLSVLKGSRWITRAYSLASVDKGQKKLRFLVKPSTPRSQSSQILSLASGSQVFVQGPFGDLRNRGKKPKINTENVHCIAFGIGAAPLLGILGDLAAELADVPSERQNGGEKSAATVRVWYSGGEVMRKQIEETLSPLPNSELHLVEPGRALEIAPLIQKFGNHARWLVCGAPDSVARLNAERKAAGIPDSMWRSEAFSETALDAPLHSEKHTVLLHPSRLLVEVPAGLSILAAFEADAKVRAAVGAEIFNGCGIGRCGSCRARLISGSVAGASGADIFDGIRLCASWPESDCEIEVE